MGIVIWERAAFIGAPGSAGACGPGQEKAPQALRVSGLIRSPEDRNMSVNDKNDVTSFRWKADKQGCIDPDIL